MAGLWIQKNAHDVDGAISSRPKIPIGKSHPLTLISQSLYIKVCTPGFVLSDLGQSLARSPEGIVTDILQR